MNNFILFLLLILIISMGYVQKSEINEKQYSFLKKISIDVNIPKEQRDVLVKIFDENKTVTPNQYQTFISEALEYSSIVQSRFEKLKKEISMIFYILSALCGMFGLFSAIRGMFESGLFYLSFGISLVLVSYIYIDKITLFCM
ncbi:MAG TPA: hypothetical protein DCM31_07730 [Deferribacteraceae bacterium]|nr:hypothetical protein [Deferribacteraceae bacterium]